MTILELLKQMYLMRGVIQDAFNIHSELYVYIQYFQHKDLIVAFSENLRALLTRTHLFDNDAEARLTTRFAQYLDALMDLIQGNLKPMILYLQKHNDVALFLCSYWWVLEKLYYEFKGQKNDTILLDEYSLILDEHFNVVRVDWLKNYVDMSNQPFKKEYLYGFFKKINEDNGSFFSKNPKEREQFIEAMTSFFSIRSI